jgi:hypothetical protein
MWHAMSYGLMGKTQFFLMGPTQVGERKTFLKILLEKPPDNGQCLK